VLVAAAELRAVAQSVLISVETADLRQFEADVIALAYAWRLFGVAESVADAIGLSEAALEQHLPSIGSLHLEEAHGRIKARRVLYVSVVPLLLFDYVVIRKFGFDVLKGLKSLAPDTRTLALTIAPGLDVVKSLRAQIDGFVEAVQAHECPDTLETISIVDRRPAFFRQIQTALSALLPAQRIEVDLAARAGGQDVLQGGWRGEVDPGSPEVREVVKSLVTAHTAAKLHETGADAVPATAPRRRFDVFLCYKSADVQYANEVTELLNSRGLRVFFSRDSLPTLGSDEYREQIDLAVESAQHMVVVTSSGEHTNSTWVKYEWGLFLGEKLAGRKSGNLVTVIVGDMAIDDLPISLRHREVIRFVPGERERLFEYLKSTPAGPDG
jgi:hypothetical protein